MGRKMYVEYSMNDSEMMELWREIKTFRKRNYREDVTERLGDGSSFRFRGKKFICRPVQVQTLPYYKITPPQITAACPRSQQKFSNITAPSI